MGGLPGVCRVCAFNGCQSEQGWAWRSWEDQVGLGRQQMSCGGRAWLSKVVISVFPEPKCAMGCWNCGSMMCASPHASSHPADDVRSGRPGSGFTRHCLSLWHGELRGFCLCSTHTAALHHIRHSTSGIWADVPYLLILTCLACLPPRSSFSSSSAWRRIG